MKRSLEKLLIMIEPTFVDLQRFIVGSWFVVKKVVMLGERSLPLYFCKLLLMGCIYKIRKILRFLVDYESSWIAMGNRDNPT